MNQKVKGQGHTVKNAKGRELCILSSAQFTTTILISDDRNSDTPTRIPTRPDPVKIVDLAIWRPGSISGIKVT